MTTGATTPGVPYFARYIKPSASSNATSTYTLTAGDVRLQSVEVPGYQVVDAVVFVNYATVAGNITVGLYAAGAVDTCAGGVLVAESASTAMAGANARQVIAFSAPVTLAPGQYFIAIEGSDATATIGAITNTNQPFPAAGQKYARAGGYGALTNPCPAVTDNQQPMFCLLRVVH